MGELDLLPLTEAAVQAGCSERVLYSLIAGDLVRPQKVPRDRRTYVLLAEVRAALAQLPPARRRPKAWRQQEQERPPPA